MGKLGDSTFDLVFRLFNFGAFLRITLGCIGHELSPYYF
jgi:hypothetical protein